jgi:hypothetical protein
MEEIVTFGNLFDRNIGHLSCDPEFSLGHFFVFAFDGHL